MNCKPGELAIIVRCAMSPEVIGTIVMVLDFASIGQVFNSPDGIRHVSEVDGYFVESCGRKFPPNPRVSSFSVVAKYIIRPIRPGDMEDETVYELEAQ
jgi:hypothetical protein